MKTRFIAAAAAAVMVCSAFTGCSKMPGKEATAQEVLAKTAEIVDAAKSESAKISLQTNIYTEGIQMNMTGDLNFALVKEAAEYSLDGTLSLFGMDIDLQIFTVNEDGKMMTYTNSFGSWSKEEASENAIGSNINIAKAFADKKDELKMTSDDNSYIIKGIMSADDFEKSSGLDPDAAGELLGSDEETNEEIQVIYTVDKKTYAPVKIVIEAVENDMAETSDETETVTETAAETEAAEETETAIESGYSSDEESPEIVLTITDITFDTVDKIELPESAKDAEMMPSFDEDYNSEDVDDAVIDGIDASEETVSETN